MKRNILSPGDFLTLVPVGLPVTLQYSDKGILEKVYFGIDPNIERLQNISERILSTMLKHRSVPVKISVTGGTTWVRGAIYTASEISGNGPLPYAIKDIMISEYLSAPSNFNFFAGDIESLATQFKGAAPIRRWLSMAGFNLLPGKILPATITDTVIEQLFHTDTYPFTWPLVTHYIIHDYNGSHYVDLGLSVHEISQIDRFVDPAGFIRATIHVCGATQGYEADYTTIAKYPLSVGSTLFVDADMHILHARSNSTQDPIRTLTCAICGAKIPIPDSGVVCCSDPNCLSRMYEAVKHMLHVLGLADMSYQTYCKYISDKSISCISDVLLLDEYKEVEISATLSQILRAAVPESEVVSNTIFEVFVNHCNNNLKTVLYYLHNPNILISDMSTVPGSQQFFNWLSDGRNVSTIEAILDSDKIHVSAIYRKFEGAPIFRNKTIYITGKFRHGDHSNIIAILQSYSATVVTDNKDAYDGVLVGDLQEDVDGSVIRYARNNGIPIMIESEFFNRYGIDEDLHANL